MTIPSRVRVVLPPVNAPTRGAACLDAIAKTIARTPNIGQASEQDQHIVDGVIRGIAGRGGLTRRLLALSASVTMFASNAHGEQVNAAGTAIVGGALLGAEVVTITEGLIGVHPWWAYVVGGGLGAVGGGIGGYYIQNASSEPQAPVAMIAAGLGLVIPALVLSLNATRYRSSDDASEDNAPRTSGALLNLRGTALQLDVPWPTVQPVYPTHVINQYGVTQQTELRVPAVSITF